MHTFLVSINIFTRVYFLFSYHFKNFSGQFQIDKENYETLKHCLDELLQLIEDLKSIKINNVVYELEYFFSSDYKLLLLILGKQVTFKILTKIS